ncbi:putative polygalacturonase [Arachis hypogaea]|nr:putative polygalacturonase [Arachis hypogaea]
MSLSLLIATGASASRLLLVLHLLLKLSDEIVSEFGKYPTCPTRLARKTPTGDPNKVIGDGKTLNTVAFQNAIFYLKSFTDKGGAQLYVPSGKWLTGSLNLISHLTLFLERGATIIASHISRALAAAGSTEIMKKLSKFMYDEEKALEEDQALAKEAAETVVLVIDEEGVESLISELVKSL